MQVLQGLEVATNCVEDMDEWLGIFNLKLRHMREDIESVLISRHLYIISQKYLPCSTILKFKLCLLYISHLIH